MSTPPEERAQLNSFRELAAGIRERRAAVVAGGDGAAAADAVAAAGDGSRYD